MSTTLVASEISVRITSFSIRNYSLTLFFNVPFFSDVTNFGLLCLLIRSKNILVWFDTILVSNSSEYFLSISSILKILSTMMSATHCSKIKLYSFFLSNASSDGPINCVSIQPMMLRTVL